MKKNRIEEFVKGWFIGNFQPVLFQTQDFEVAVKMFQAGEKEALHKQLIATEVTVVIDGEIQIGDSIFVKGDVITIHPGEFADFLSISDSSLVCVKFPSLPNDKVLG